MSGTYETQKASIRFEFSETCIMITFRCLANVVKIVEKNLSDDLPGFNMTVRKDLVLTDAFKRMARPSFDPNK